MIRPIVEGDMGFILGLAKERYPPFDERGFLNFLLHMLKFPTALMLRDEDAFLIANANNTPWFPWEIEGHVYFICAARGAHWQAIKLMRRAHEWALSIGAAYFYFGAETGLNLEVMARRLGAEPAAPRFRLVLQPGSIH